MNFGKGMMEADAQLAFLTARNELDGGSFTSWQENGITFLFAFGPHIHSVNSTSSSSIGSSDKISSRPVVALGSDGAAGG